MKFVLVVDDEPNILETIVDSIEIEFEEGEVDISQAINGVDALDVIKKFEHKFDLIITDLNMPEMNGIELTENIRKSDLEVPIIVFTGHGDLEEKERLEALKVKAMVRKPYVEELIEQVTQVIHK